MVPSTTLSGVVFDDAGNVSAEISFDVTVIDNTAPVIFCAGAPGFTSFDESFAGSTQPAGWEQILVEGVGTHGHLVLEHILLLDQNFQPMQLSLMTMQLDQAKQTLLS